MLTNATLNGEQGLGFVLPTLTCADTFWKNSSKYYQMLSCCSFMLPDLATNG